MSHDADAALDIEFARALLDPGGLARHLATRAPRRISEVVAPRRSAVAAILRDVGAGPEVLLMKRAPRDGDRWSGHISMPGGMSDRADADLVTTAVRETSEEVGLDLRLHATEVGRLDDQIAIASGRTLPMAITPWVFRLDHPVELALGDEAEASFWLPMARVLSGALDAVRPYSFAGVTRDLPAWRHEGFLIWGLTHRMLGNLIAIAREAS